MMRAQPYRSTLPERLTRRGRHLAWLGCLLAATLANSNSYAAVDGEDSDPGADATEAILQPLPPPPPAVQLAHFAEKVRPKFDYPEGQYLVSRIEVRGVTVYPAAAIRKFVRGYESKPLTPEQMSKCADDLTAKYRQDGYVTSYVFVDSFDQAQGTLVLVAHEGKIGQITIAGNRYFTKEVYKFRLGIQEGAVFNVKQLQIGIYQTNRSPDRKVAQPDVIYDDETEVTDVELKVKDKIPVHLTLSADNYGAWIILQGRYSAVLSLANLTGHDDKLNMKYEFSQEDTHRLYDFDYYFPLTRTWTLQTYYMPWKRENYQKDMEGMQKAARKYYFYFHNKVVNVPGKEGNFRIGAIRKDIIWLNEGDEKKNDQFRAILMGGDINVLDSYGRTIVTADAEKGFSGIAGGNSYDEENCSVPGADGRYLKTSYSLARRNKLFPGTDLLAKARAQWSDDTMTGVNAFSIGGFYGVVDDRGYPRAQYYGDRGFSITLATESIPYFISPGAKVPGCAETWREALRLFPFVDWAYAFSLTPTPSFDDSKPDPKRSTNLASAGFGAQLALPKEGWTMRLDLAWALTEAMESKDYERFHLWAKITKVF